MTRLGSAKFALPAAAMLFACTSIRSGRPPTHEALVNHHIQGKYAEVTRWCSAVLEDRGAEPALSDWCLFAYPAAMRLSLDTEGALAFVRAMCRDMAGLPKGDAEFRELYVAETTRWVALPMRFQGQDRHIGRAVVAAVSEFGEACAVEPDRVERMVDTTL